MRSSSRFPDRSSFRRIEDLEELGEPSAEVRTVFPRAVLQQIEEDVPGFEDAGIVGEEAEHDADEELLQIVPLVAGGFKRVVELAHPFGGLDVDGVLILERALLYAEDEAELLHMGGQVFERKGYLLSLVPIVQFERLEIADQNVAWPILVAKRIEILAGLIIGFSKVAPRAFLLDYQDARPEQVDKSTGIAQPLHVFLVTGYTAALNPEDPEEAIVETLRFPLFITCVFPFAGKIRRAGAYFIPGQAHALGLGCRFVSLSFARERRKPYIS